MKIYGVNVPDNISQDQYLRSEPFLIQLILQDQGDNVRSDFQGLEIEGLTFIDGEPKANQYTIDSLGHYRGIFTQADTGRLFSFEISNDGVSYGIASNE